MQVESGRKMAVACRVSRSRSGIRYPYNEFCIGMVFSIGGHTVFFSDTCGSGCFVGNAGGGGGGEDFPNQRLARRWREREDPFKGKIERLGRGFDCDGRWRPEIDGRLLAGRVLNESKTRKIASHTHAETHRTVDQSPKRFSNLY